MSVCVLHVCQCTACMSVLHVCLVFMRARRGPCVPQSEVTDGVEPLCGHWESNTGPLREQTLLLTAEPSRCYERAFKTILCFPVRDFTQLSFTAEQAELSFWIICLHHDSSGFSLEMTFSASLESSLSLEMSFYARK